MSTPCGKMGATETEGVYRGRIRTRRHLIDGFVLKPNPEYDPNNPAQRRTHDLWERTGDGGQACIGGGAAHTVNDGPCAGMPMFRLWTDDPDFSPPLQMAAFPRRDPNDGSVMWVIQHDKPKKQGAGMGGGTAAPSGGNGQGGEAPAAPAAPADAGDEIPF